MKYKRVLLKLSGEALLGNKLHGIDEKIVTFLANEIKKVYKKNIQISLVIGGGNIFRGTDAVSVGIERTTADYMGMLATVINALSMQSALEKIDVPTRVQSAISMSQIAEPYIRRKAIRHLEKNRIVIFAAGTGNPFFTTDTAAVLRASEVGAEIVIKATKIDGVYDKDPKLHSDAVRYDALNYDEVLKKHLKVMDATAIAFCRDNQLPILVLDYKEPDAILGAVCGETVGTLIKQRGS